MRTRRDSGFKSTNIVNFSQFRILEVIFFFQFLSNERYPFRWLVYLILAGVIATLMMSFPLGAMLYLCYLVRPENIPLLVIAFEMGSIINRVAASPNLYSILCQTVFFYQVRCTTTYLKPVLVLSLINHLKGQSSNISSIDIAIGYKGLSSYTAAFVGFQILANFYAAPFALTLGLLWVQPPPPPPLSSYFWTTVTAFREALRDSGYRDYTPLMSATLQLRSVILFSSLVAMISLSGHLFMFSVLAPKLICELFHIIVVLLLTISLSISCSICQLFATACWWFCVKIKRPPSSIRDFDMGIRPTTLSQAFIW